MNPDDIASLVLLASSSFGGALGAAVTLGNLIINWRQSKKKDRLTEAEAHSEVAEATDALADSMAKIAKVGQELVEQSRVARLEADAARKRAEDELRSIRVVYEMLVKAHDELAREFTAFKTQCESDKRRYESAISHLQATVDALNKSAPE